MKNNYSTPELDIVELELTLKVLNVSDPEPTVPTGGGGATPDPFGELT